MVGTRRRPGPATRIRQHLAWRRQRFDATIGTQLFIDPLHDAHRSLYLASWPRSGSTWLAELLASAPHTRLVFEPCNLPYPGKPRVGTELISLPPTMPGGDVGPAGPTLEAAVRGTLRTRWSDQLRTTFVARRRVVKEIVTIPALAWIADRWPTMPVLVLLRHPIAVADSLVELTWSMNNHTDAPAFVAALAPGADPSLLEAALLGEVRQWAIEHRATLDGLRGMDPDRVLIVFYESLLTDPAAEIERIATHLASNPAWRDWQPDHRFIARPSFASFRRADATSEERRTSWARRWSPATLDRARAILAEHGVGHLYDVEGAPACPPEDVIVSTSLDEDDR